MSDQNINIKIRLTDEMTKGLQKASVSLKEFSRQAKELGRNLSQVGMAMTAVGTGITAPLILAYKQAGKFNYEIASQLQRTQNVFDNLSVSIGKSLLPIMRELTEAVARAVDWWKGLEQATRDKIVQNLMKLGVALVMLGTSLVVLGQSLKLLANLAVLLSALAGLNPIVLGIVVVIGLLVSAMIKWRVVSDFVANSLEILIKIISIAIKGVMAFTNAIKGNFGEAKKYAIGLQEEIEKIGSILSGKNGDMANGIERYRLMIEELGEAYQDFKRDVASGKTSGSQEPADNFMSSFATVMRDAEKELRTFAKAGEEIANGLVNSLTTSFNHLFSDAFKGQLDSAEEYFAEWGQSLLDLFAQVLAEIVAKWAVVNALKGLGFGGLFMHDGGIVGNKKVTVSSFHNGGIIKAHSGLAVDEVPIIAQRGERVLSRTQNRAYEQGMSGGGQSPIVVIQAWDTQDIMRNRKSIEGIIINALKNNSSLRGAVKTYG